MTHKSGRIAVRVVVVIVALFGLLVPIMIIRHRPYQPSELGLVSALGGRRYSDPDNRMRRIYRFYGDPLKVYGALKSELAHSRWEEVKKFSNGKRTSDNAMFVIKNTGESIQFATGDRMLLHSKDGATCEIAVDAIF